MTFKVGQIHKSGPDAARNSAHGQTQSQGRSDNSETRGGRTYGHDNTPTRQRELETHGNNLRSRVEGQSNKHGDGHHSQQSQPSQSSSRSQHSAHSQDSDHSEFSFLKSDHGIGVRVGGDRMGAEIEVGLGLNKSHGGDKSPGGDHSTHSEHFNSLNSDHGVGVRFSGDRMGGEVEARLGLNKSHGNDHSPNSEHFSSRNSDRGLDVRINGDRIGVEIEARLGFNKSHGGDRSDQFHSDHVQGDFRGRTDGHSDHRGPQSKIEASPNPQRLFREHSNTHDEGGRIGDHHHSTEFRSEFQRSADRGWSQHSAEHSNSGKSELRDTLRNVRNELNRFRSDAREGPVNRSIGLADRHIDRVVQLATRGLENSYGRGEQSERIARQVMSDASGVVRVAEHFSHLERTGGEPVRRAYEAVLNFLLNDGFKDRQAEPNRLRLAMELLRDLGGGAFLNPRDMGGPFPLTGRARVVSEMMELIRTIEAIEKFAQEMSANPNRTSIGDWSVFARGTIPGGLVANEILELITQVLANTGPNFPGLAGRLEIPHLIAALDGVLTDSAGRPLISADGTPLKLGELLWFNGRPESAGDLFTFDRLPTRMSPVLIHGFDAVYSVIGFDGRQLSLPRFMAIQSQINASEFEWLFGQAPLSEGWIRSAIEFLKDSISVDHNVLGELLEEAVTSGRFHLTVMHGTVEEGKAVSGSFSFTPVPNFTPAFNPR